MRLALLGSVWLLTACGQAGDLYLPADPAATPAPVLAPAQVPAQAPADAEPKKKDAR